MRHADIRIPRRAAGADIGNAFARAGGAYFIVIRDRCINGYSRGGTVDRGHITVRTVFRIAAVNAIFLRVPDRAPADGCGAAACRHNGCDGGRGERKESERGGIPAQVAGCACRGAAQVVICPKFEITHHAVRHSGGQGGAGSRAYVGIGAVGICRPVKVITMDHPGSIPRYGHLRAARSIRGSRRRRRDKVIYRSHAETVLCNGTVGVQINFENIATKHDGLPRKLASGVSIDKDILIVENTDEIIVIFHIGVRTECKRDPCGVADTVNIDHILVVCVRMAGLHIQVGRTVDLNGLGAPESVFHIVRCLFPAE